MISEAAFRPTFDVTPAADRFGWIDDPQSVAEVVGRMAMPIAGLAMGPAFLATEDRDCFLWLEGEMALFGKTLPAHAQTIGDCVSQSWGRAVQDLVLIEMARAGVAGAEAFQIATEVIYAFSRVEIGRGRLGSGDGSIGAWAAEAEIKYGNLQRKKYANIDLTTYSGAIAKRLGAPRAGVPDELEPESRLHVVAQAPMVVTADELKAALHNLYAVPICSNQGFTETRDQYGFCKPQGQWAHCMCARGICTAKHGSSSVTAIIIQQSWGESPTGPNTLKLESGKEVTLPQGCFAVEIDDVVNRMLNGRDSFAPVTPGGFVERRPLFDLI